MKKSIFVSFLMVGLVLLLSCHPAPALALSDTPWPHPAAAWQGEVVGISDGDTITVLHNGKGEKIRLYGIDTPEMKQAFGKRAKQFTSDQVFRKTVKVVPMDTDRYGRTVGMVYPISGAESLNEAIVREGYAWVYRKYCKADFCAGWLEVEQTAKGRGLGLWVDGSAVPPWEFRRVK
ncbi:thermonuclease family protein [uncultured Desulfosarcina sp.]|uniref:thermonuclease family protein n=1 Tax=uncultured Desulfosarcina sp. TaxID=218289 RepID=UPI0029C6E59F|nr:thermonuclease family protein [uncultured Desulfosarcina sp.]